MAEDIDTVTPESPSNVRYLKVTRHAGQGGRLALQRGVLPVTHQVTCKYRSARPMAGGSSIQRESVQWLYEVVWTAAAEFSPSVRYLRGRYKVDPLASASEEVRAFCNQNEISVYTRKAYALARQCFPNIQSISLQVERDPESDGQYLLLEVAVKASVEDAFDGYSHYIEKMAGTIRGGNSNLIKTTYHIA